MRPSTGDEFSPTFEEDYLDIDHWPTAWHVESDDLARGKVMVLHQNPFYRMCGIATFTLPNRTTVPVSDREAVDQPEDHSMKALAVAGLIACFAPLPAWADCVEPQISPHLPDGTTASREDMVFAMQAIRVYDAAVKEFSQCARTIGQIQQADRAVDKLTAIADKFNRELYAFKKKSGA